ncbi:hypothetical protein GQ53DRAFT_778657 [Thozetella sp. PMI_491]|nr:hypothetical protein GQ53DRAFT_778657 [Thozetella sp. PMI_491]
MPFEQTVTIINNSGKIISTGKHLVNIFKDAKAAYKEKKDAIKAERGPVPGIQRAKTFDVSGRAPGVDPRYGYGYGHGEIDHVYDRSVYSADYDDHHGRRRSIDDDRSHASSRHSRRSHRHRSSSHHRPPLTESNLRTLSEVSSVAPSGAPKGYRSPYAETANSRALTLSRPTLAARTMTMPAAPSTVMRERGAPVPTPTTTAVSTPRQSMLVHRPRSDSSLRKKPKEIDMNLAYGNIPPDLESRVDLDPNYKNSPELQEVHARSLMDRVEGLLVEAHCVHHTATAIISNLQANPEAAAAVALTLAELSALLTKMSPAFLGVIKGGSPAVFALLASPQFLIGAGVAVGVTVVMFGGWKIIKRIKESGKEQEQAFEMQQPAAAPGGPMPPPPVQPGYGFAQGMAFGRGGPGSFDEALVLEEELSTIETWRRGIAPFGDDETADIELISPEAERTILEQRRHDREDDEIDPSDSVSRSGRSTKTHRTSKSHKTHKSRRHSERDREDSEFVPERKSSKGFSKDSDRDHDRDREDRDDRGSRSGRSEGSHRSSRHGSSSGSKRPERVALKAIEDGSRESENTLDAVLRPKEKKNTSMLKTLFKKKKNKDDQEKERSERGAISVMA